MRKLVGAIVVVALVVLALTVAAPAAPEGAIQDVGNGLRAFWGYPVSGP
ncbi:MAG: hypothetical protein ACE5MI_09900 [Acidimicrobiia bacterium]